MVRKRNKRHVLNAWSYNTCHKIHGMFVADHTNLVYCLFCPILPTYSSHHWKERNTTIPLVREIVQCLELQISQPRLIILIIFCFFPSHWNQNKLYWKKHYYCRSIIPFFNVMYIMYKMIQSAGCKNEYFIQILSPDLYLQITAGVPCFPPFSLWKEKDKMWKPHLLLK